MIRLKVNLIFISDEEKQATRKQMKFDQCSMSKEGILLNLRKGLDSEVRARDLCQELLEVLDDENDKKIIKKILDDEESHIKITEDLISTAEAFYIG